MKTPDISVVVCTYNRAEMLREALENLIRQETEGKFSYEILVVDDASTDDTSSVVQEIARHSQAPVRYVRVKGKGYTSAINRGGKHSDENRDQFIRLQET